MAKVESEAQKERRDSNEQTIVDVEYTYEAGQPSPSPLSRSSRGRATSPLTLPTSDGTHGRSHSSSRSGTPKAPKSRTQPYPNPNLSLASGSGVNNLFPGAGSGTGTGEGDRRPRTASPHSASLFERAKQAIMVASPRLPFYSDERSSSRSTNMKRSTTSTTTTKHTRNTSAPSLAFTGPPGLFSSPNPTISGLFGGSGLGITSAGYLSPRLGHSPAGRFASPSSKRPFFNKEKSDEDLSGPKGDMSMRRVASTPGKASFFRLPRSILRLFSRRSRTFPILVILLTLTLWAMGYGRRASIHDENLQQPPSRMNRLLQASLPGTGLQVGDLNPMKWAKVRAGEVQQPFGVTDFDVLAYDPAGPGVEIGSVGTAEKRYLSWEGGRKDGRMLVKEGEKHPIPMLMQRAKQRWHALKARQSKSFAQAVIEYERRYGRKPPKGFDRWYAFAKYHDVQLIDEFNIIEDDFRMFRAFSGPSFRARVQKLHDQTDFAWDIKIMKGIAVSEGELKGHDRAKGVLHLISKFAHELPDMHIVYNGHDIARQNTGWEERERLDALVAAGEYDHFNATDTEMKPEVPSVAPGWGMPTICPPDSAVRQEVFDYGFSTREWNGLEMSEKPAGAVGTVVDSFYKYMDVCDSPQYRHMHSSSSYVFPWHPTPTLPLFTAGVHSHFSDIHCIITEQFGLEARYDPTWEERPFNAMIFKGQSSGPFYDKNSAWKSSHRARLHILSHNEEGSRNITVTDKKDIVRSIEVPNFQLNPTFLDTGIVGPPVQCHEEDGTCDEMKKVFNGFDPRVTFEKASLYKYVGDFDGNSWSGRFPRLMASNAAVVKATLYREFWTDWAIPWLHFIPVQVDYSDLWDVLAFFRGGPKGEGAHDGLGRQIALAGKDWARSYFRYEDMEAFTFRQYLEYARLYADDRDSMSYDGEVEGYEPVWTPREEVKL